MREPKCSDTQIYDLILETETTLYPWVQKHWRSSQKSWNRKRVGGPEEQILAENALLLLNLEILLLIIHCDPRPDEFRVRKFELNKSWISKTKSWVSSNPKFSFEFRDCPVRWISHDYMVSGYLCNYTSSLWDNLKPSFLPPSLYFRLLLIQSSVPSNWAYFWVIR